MNPSRGLKSAHNQVSADPIQKMALVLDHLVDALARDPSSSLRRALILLDIDANPNTSQTEILDRLGKELDLDKSSLNREIQWLYDFGCILRQSGHEDGRVIHMVTCGYSKKSLNLALDYVENSHKNLQIMIKSLINLFKEEKPTLRDAKLLLAMADLGEGSKADLFDRAYAGAPSSNARALESLIEQGLIKKTETE
jgi:DNA-binding MarR family transcriptional regulator